MFPVRRFLPILFLSPLVAAAQIVLVNHTVNQGLSQNTVTCIYRDSRGFLWVGTQDGLNIFDGHRFVRYRHDDRDSNSISDRYVTSIMEDGSGNLMIGTRNGLSLFDRVSRRFQRIYPDPIRKRSFQYPFEKIEKTASGDLFISGDSRLYHWDHKLKRIRMIDTDLLTVNNFTVQGDTCLLVDGQGRVMKLRAPFSYTAIGATDMSFREKAWVQADRKGRIWRCRQVSEALARVERFDRVTGQWVGAVEVAGKANHISFDKGNTAWVSTMNGILLVPESGRAERFKEDGVDLDAEVLFTHTDAGGITWIGFAHRGLGMYDPAMKAFRRKTAPKPEEPVLSSLELPGKGLLLGTPSGLHLSNDLGSKRLISGAVASMARASNGEIWVGTEKDGVFVLDASLRVKRRFDNRNSVLKENRIHHLEFDSVGGRMIVSTINGAYFHTLEDGTWTSLSVDPPGDASSALCGSYVLNARVLRNGDFVVSTNNGFSVLGRGGEVRRKVYSDNDSCRFIRKTIVTGSTEDGKGRLWVATLSRGVFVASADTFRNFGEVEGLSSNLVYGIVTDVHGRVWVATSSGMDVIDPVSERILRLSEYNGLPTADYSFGCLSRGEGDVLHINSSIGMVSVRTGAVHPEVNRLKPLIQAVKVNYEDVDLRSDYTLGPLDKTLSFEFSAPYYRDPDNLVFQYRIRKIQDKWVALEPGNRTLTLTNLPSGEFVLETRCSDFIYDMEGAETVETRIKVPLPFWRDPFYIVPALLIVMALVAFAVHRSARKAMAEKLRESEMSELLYKERERISRDLHDNLGAYASSIRNNVLELERSSGEGIVLDNLKENTDVMMNALRETIWVLQNETVSITSLSDRFKKFANRVGAGYPSVTIDFRESISTDILLSPTEGINLMRVMQEALTNSLKHSGCGRITVDIKSTDILKVRISDDGTGFDPESGIDDSFGLRNMRSRAAEAGFEFRMETSPSGTYVLVFRQMGQGDL